MKMKKVPLFIKNSIVFSAAILILVNIFNFDYLIAHYDSSRTGRGVDYTYLSTLSPDSLSYRIQFEKLREVTGKGDYELTKYDNENPLILLYKIERLQEKYENVSFQTISILDFIQYRKVKDIDTSGLRQYYESKRSNN